MLQTLRKPWHLYRRGPGSSLAVPDLGALAVIATASALPAGWMNGAFM